MITPWRVTLSSASKSRANSIIHRLLSNASPTQSNKVTIAAHFISHSWRRPLAKDSKGLVGFHGAGGGGSMMSMDAIVNAGFTIANFTDTSGNPSASKVYRAARIILAQPDLVGYFGSGSGVASQEQYWSAYGLAKAFWELDLDIPAVIRLGGNTEDRAVDILHRMSNLLRAPVEGYRKTDTPATIAARFAELVGNAGGAKWKPRTPARPEVHRRFFSHCFSGEKWSCLDRRLRGGHKFEVLSKRIPAD